MKTKLNFLPFLIIFSVLIFSTSCKKEGCTDSTATNYNAEADKDDGSCEYPVVDDNNNTVTQEFIATVDGGSFNVTTFSAVEQGGYYAIMGSNTNNNTGISLSLSTSSSSGSLGAFTASYAFSGTSESASSGTYSYTVDNNVISGTFAFETASHSITNGEFTIEL